MPEFDNTNRGVLFRVKDKKTDRHPDYNGEITLPNGKCHWLSAWLKQSNQGTPYLSLSIGDEKQARDNSGANSSAPMDQPPLDDDIPF